MIRYHIPPGVETIHSDQHILLSTQPGGRVMVDRMILQLWQTAHQRCPAEILAEFRPSVAHPFHLLAGLACLAEAGLLERSGDSCPAPVKEVNHSTASGCRISVVIVSYNSRAWLNDCLDSLQAQNLAPFEIILIDNGSQDGSADWIEQRHPDVRLIRLPQPTSLAHAINTGLRSASGDFYLLLNPDTRLASDALAQIVQIAHQNPHCAAVAAKLRLLWTPQFLNGLGNLVGPISWGADIGLGHLDLGQFDQCSELPSACFAAALLPAEVIEAVGLLDEQFPLYFEDSEWCYRARLMGYTIQAAPRALVYHAFSGRTPAEASASLAPAKLRRVVYGRLNFNTKINAWGYFLRFWIYYRLEDLARLCLAGLRGQSPPARAILLGWQDYQAAWPELIKRRRQVQSQRCLSNRQLYRLQRQAPAPMVQQGIPQLTWDGVCSHYARLILNGQTRALPEFSDFQADELTKATLSAARQRCSLPSASQVTLLRRVQLILRYEGPGALLRRMAKGVQWRLMQMR